MPQEVRAHPAKVRGPRLGTSTETAGEHPTESSPKTILSDAGGPDSVGEPYRQLWAAKGDVTAQRNTQILISIMLQILHILNMSACTATYVLLPK